MTVGTRIQHRRDTAANWTSANPTLLAGEPALETDTGKQKIGDGATAWTALAYQVAPLVPTATKTAGYTAAVGDLAMMNVAGGATALTLPTAPLDKAQVGYRAIGATTAVPLVVTAGGSDTIGTAGATTASVPLADEVVVLQYQATGTRWLAVANVKSQASLDARYFVETAETFAAAGSAITLGNPLTTGTMKDVTLTANCTISLPAVVGGASFIVRVKEGGSGGYTATFSGSVQWGASGVQPSNTLPLGSKDEYVFHCWPGDTFWTGGLANKDIK